jgi:hypothetical protein
MPGTLGNPALVRLTHNHREAIALSFKAKKVFVLGEPVQLASDGEVDSVSAGQKTLGFVHMPNKDGAIGDSVTVVTPFIAVMTNVKASSAGAIATGDLIKIDATATQSGDVPTYSVAASTEIATGICLSGADASGTIKVGILPTPITVV